jgi:hypothetical protein
LKCLSTRKENTIKILQHAYCFPSFLIEHISSSNQASRLSYTPITQTEQVERRIREKFSWEYQCQHRSFNAIFSMVMNPEKKKLIKTNEPNLYCYTNTTQI